MELKAIRRYADLLVNTVLSEIDDVSSPAHPTNIPTRKFVSKDNVYIIDKNKFEKKLLRPLLEVEGWGKKFTETYIEKSLRVILFRTCEEGKKKRNSRAQKYFTELVNEVEDYSRERIVYIPLDNIQLRFDSLELGPITLINMTDELFQILTNHIENTLVNAEMTPEMKQQSSQLWIQDLRGNVCARYFCIAEPDRAAERAQEECQRIFELMRFAIHMLGRDHYRIAIGRKHEVSRFWQTTPVFSKDGEQFSSASITIGPLAPFIIEPQIMQRLEEIGIFKVAGILTEEVDEDCFHETLLRSIRWFSNAQTQVIKENQFLNLMTCLETFLVTRGTEEITQSVARGVAAVLKTTHEDRELMKRKVVDLYEHRSSISHGGRSAMLISDLEELRDIVGDFLAIMIQRSDEFKTRKDLDTWIESVSGELNQEGSNKMSRE